MFKENSRIDISNTYNQYDDLTVAKNACLNDSQCIGIYDSSCDKTGPFLLLTYGFMTSIVGVNCVYKKKTYGKYLLIAISSWNVKALKYWKIESNDIKTIHFLCISDPGSKCFDVSMYKPMPYYKWSFANCSDTLKWLGSGTYTYQCCVPDGVHILTCSSGFYGQADWSRSALIMLGHQFCEDFVGHKAFIALNTTGGYKYTKNIFFYTSK